MIEQLNTAYIQYRRVKALVLLGLLTAGILLYSLSGGFPPWAWRFLFQVLPQLFRLWSVQGAALLLPLFGLMLLSVALLVLWIIIITLICKVIIHWQRDAADQQRFEGDLREAERLADEGLATEAVYAQYNQRTEQVPVAAPPAQARQRANTRPTREPGSSITPVPSTYPPPVTRPQTARRVSVPPAAMRAQGMRGQAEVYAQGPYAAPAHTAFVGHQLRIVQSPLVDDPVDEVDSYGDDAPSPVSWQDVTRRRRRAEWDEEDTLDVAQHDTMPVPAAVFEEDSAVFEEDEDSLADFATQPGRDTEEPVVPEVPLQLVVGIGLDPGITRKDAPNEDSLFAIQGMRVTDAGPTPAGLFVVADGMGGHANGREASRLAIRSLTEIIVPELLRDVSGEGVLGEDIFLAMLKEGVHRANLAIYKRNRERPQMMGTTVTAVLIANATAYVMNVGDSRTYLYRTDEGLKQLTRDHSLVARLVEDGTITRDEVYTHPRRNQIYRCLGERASVEMDTLIKPLQAGDSLILCSDGLWEMVRDGSIENIVASSAHPTLASSALVQEALKHGGADNISVIVVGIAETEE